MYLPFKFTHWSPTRLRESRSLPTTDEPGASDGDTLSPGPSPVNASFDKEAARKAYASYNETLNVEHLDTVIRFYQRAYDAAPEWDAASLGWLGECLLKRYKMLGTLDDLQRGIEAHKRALTLMAVDHPDRALLLSCLASSLRSRYERLGDLNDLDHAVDMQERVVELTSDSSPSLTMRLHNLSYLHHLRFRCFGDLEDLQRAISGQQRAVDLTPVGHRSAPSRLNNLGWSFRARFERLGEQTDLASAIELQQRAVELGPVGHPDMPRWLSSLSSLRHLRYECLGNPDDLKGAIEGQQRALKLTPNGHPNKAAQLHNLGLTLRSRCELAVEASDLEYAITVQRRAVNLTSVGHPSMPIYLDNLGCLEHLRFRSMEDLNDLKSAITGQRLAVKLTADEHPDKPMLLHNLGVFLVAFFRKEETEQSFREAFFCLMDATSQSLGSSTRRLDAAKYAVEFLNANPKFSTPDALILAHYRILEIIPELVWLGHSLTRRIEELKHLGELVNSAVSAAIGVGALVPAMEWLNAGRTLLWTQALSLRSPVDELERKRPDLAQSLKRVLVQLRSPLPASPHRNSTSFLRSLIRVRETPNYTSEADHHRGLAIEYGKLLVDIRHQPGFGSFMRPEKLPALLPWCMVLSEPIVFLNVDATRCDALLLNGEGVITAVSLSDLSLQKAEKLRYRWQTYLQQRNVRERRFSSQQQGCSSEPSEGAKILGRIWRWIVHPVLEALGIRVTEDASHDHLKLPHITWCPTGPLTQLPLHAAGIYNEESGPHVYDFVVSSYTPSLSALTRNIDALTKQRDTSGVLVVTQPATPGYDPLPGTSDEGSRLRNVFEGSKTAFSVFDGEQATIGAVKRVLGEKSWLHLACHGHQDLADPLRSAFALHDGPLSLSELMATTSDNAELAFLSACQTAVGDETIPEESMHLAAGMLAIGYKGVVATMWSIRDDDAPLVVETYYMILLGLRVSGTLGKGETGAAYALHQATKALREQVGVDEVARWAPFVHFGI